MSTYSKRRRRQFQRPLDIGSSELFPDDVSQQFVGQSTPKSENAPELVPTVMSNSGMDFTQLAQLTPELGRSVNPELDEQLSLPSQLHYNGMGELKISEERMKNVHPKGHKPWPEDMPRKLTYNEMVELYGDTDSDFIMLKYPWSSSGSN
uniref:ARAD1A17622p n=1 Tax=Blastobotrys adeninivorans TaxID=409370 RepID=A0A060T3P0_BLAAD